MNRRRGRTLALAAVAAALLAGCAPPAQNGDTVSLPAVVPAPASIEQAAGAPFRLSDSTRIEGEADAATALTALVKARTGLSPAADGDGDGDGPTAA
jgi:hexosaminidase